MVKTKRIEILRLLASLLFLATSTAFAEVADQPLGLSMYDESAYTEFVENKMTELDGLYLQFCETCGADASAAALARKEFLISVRDLMQHMNSRFDALDPKKGAALSPTETLVSIHALTMLVDILTATQLEHMAKHPYIE